MQPLSYQEMLELDRDLWILEKNCRGYMRDCYRGDQEEWWKLISNIGDFRYCIDNLVGPQRQNPKTDETAWMFTFEAYEIVYFHCEEIMRMRPPWRNRHGLVKRSFMDDTSLPDRSKAGCVYLLKFGSHYKIGMTKDLNCRLSSLNLALPEPCELICKIETSNFAMLEKQLHERFAAKRCNGEWFLLNEEDLEYLRLLAGEDLPF